VPGMIRRDTTCGRCELPYDRCVIVTVKTIHADYQLVELCKQCLEELVLVITNHKDVMDEDEDA